MNRNASPILRPSSSRRKRKNQPVSYFKKLRSKIPRRKRCQISPILCGSRNSEYTDKKTEFSAFPAVSCSSSSFPGETSCTSSRIPVQYKNLKKENPKFSQRKGEFEEIQGSGAVIRAEERSFRKPERISGEEFQRITRSYHRQKGTERTVETNGNGDHIVEFPESYCVESFSGANDLAFPGRNSKLKSRY
ncbi:hypothetical protein HHK36_024223 [Tetracentron sinense]|uniref:Uncharacterized protein n=1 Tax=Tetracentron sinense TaxID=13715 RepID=A0A835D7A8_TETSI|nr:hypothetical protein HHK36_024223 [Tetracentron sinense]